MKLIKLLFTVSIALFLQGCGNKNAKTSEELAGKIIKSFIDGKSDDFKYYLLNSKDAGYLVKNNSMYMRIKESQIDEYVKAKHEDCMEDFFEILNKGKNAGVDWKKLNTNDIKIKETNKKDDFVEESVISFSYEGKTFQILLNDLIKTKRGWILNDDPKFRILE